MSVLFTLLSVSLGLSFTVEMAVFVQHTIREMPLSRTLTTVPSTLTIAFSEALIRASSLWFRHDLSKVLALTAQLSLKKSGDRVVRHFWIAPAPCCACAVVRFIVVGFVNTGTTLLATTFKTGTNWDQLLALWMALNELFHDWARFRRFAFSSFLVDEQSRA